MYQWKHKMEIYQEVAELTSLPPTHDTVPTLTLTQC